MSQPDSSLNSASSVLVASPLCHPKFKPVESTEYSKTLAQLYFLDCQRLHLVFDTKSGYFPLFFCMYTNHNFTYLTFEEKER